LGILGEGDKVNKPNILFIMSDEHNASVMGTAGDKIVKTPNLDQLAHEGVVFDNCYTPSPICVPARLSITAGKYISKCGAWSNESMLESDNITSIATVLSKQGYDCYLGGKMHYSKERRYGMDELYPFWTNTNIRKPYNKRIDLTDGEFESRESELSPRFDKFYVGDDNRVMDHDRKVTEICCDVINNRKKEDSPFFLIAGYLAPHFPLIVPEKYYEMYRDKVPMPVIPENHIESFPKHYKVMQKAFKNDQVDSSITKKGRELYYGLVTWFDEEVGKLLDSLNDSEIKENTIVIYTSDHGENMGEHGLWWKNSMYDCSVKVPLIVSWPKRWGQGIRKTEICNLLDIIQTICDVAGADIPPDWDGNSMVDFLDDENSPWKDYAVSEYYAHGIAAGHCMIRKGDYKYVYFNKIDENNGEERQLFNMKDDPNEFNNLIKDPQYKDTVHELHDLLVKELGREPSEVEKESREIINR
jgi:choline-sulfatase